jgi:hypothetical protein
MRKSHVLTSVYCRFRSAKAGEQRLPCPPSIKVVAVHTFDSPGRVLQTGFDVGMKIRSPPVEGPSTQDLPHRPGTPASLPSCGSNGRSRIIIWLVAVSRMMKQEQWLKPASADHWRSKLRVGSLATDPYTHITHRGGWFHSSTWFTKETLLRAASIFLYTRCHQRLSSYSLNLHPGDLMQNC